MFSSTVTFERNLGKVSTQSAEIVQKLGRFFSFASKAIRICMAVTCDKM